jgi:hypothetical protein
VSGSTAAMKSLSDVVVMLLAVMRSICNNSVHHSAVFTSCPPHAAPFYSSRKCKNYSVSSLGNCLPNVIELQAVSRRVCAGVPGGRDGRSTSTSLFNYILIFSRNVFIIPHMRALFVHI